MEWWYTLNSIVSHMWQPKVHMILQSFVVLTWVRDAIELVSVECDTME
jgi:hypothetical protein